MPDLFVQRTAGQTVARQLAQTQPVTAVSLYTPGDGVQCVVKRIIICNTSSAAAAFDIYHDDDGTTYNATTQLFKDYTISAGVTFVMDEELFLDSDANVAAACDVTAALTFSVYGEEVQVRAR
jgi:hypothetical protein